MNKTNYGVRPEAIKLIEALAKFGTLSTKLFQILFNKKQQQINLITNKLVSKKLIVAKRHKYNASLIYKPTQRGLNLTKYFDYSIPKGFDWTHLDHKLSIINFVISQNLDFHEFWTDREIKIKNLVDYKRTPDLLVLKNIYVSIDGEQIQFNENSAFEFELISKSKNKYKTIFQNYDGVDPNKILWICSPNAYSRIKRYYKELKNETNFHFFSQKHFFIIQKNKQEGDNEKK